MKTRAAGVRIELRGPVRNADVVALDVEMDETERVNLVERRDAVMRKPPPVRAILEHVTADLAVACDGQQRAPLVDRNAGVVGLHQPRAAHHPAIELHDVRDTTNAVSD